LSGTALVQVAVALAVPVLVPVDEAIVEDMMKVDRGLEIG